MTLSLVTTSFRIIPNTRMQPITTITTEVSIPQRLMALRTVNSVSAPNSAPGMEPYPPFMELPPSTAATTAWNSSPSPTVGCRLLVRIITTIPATAARNPDSM